MDELRPGVPIPTSSTGRPVMVLLDLLGRRAALRILWELSQESPMTFRALQTASETNPGVLNTRLKELRALDLVEHGEGGYRVSVRGAELSEILRTLTTWASNWSDLPNEP
ncbi:winged helix-turn-helix transcriptional regulator [Nocardia lasii]|uniref:Winged helix-turn-helix transcriptional regulator n=1 Tax=Nocardia lasii TaxID=1616107 RepID=A0ABW1JML8_9NOCA